MGTRSKIWVPPAKNMIQLKVVLKFMRPPIWRRVVLPDNYTLGNLHEVIQVAMGWHDCHMHRFEINDVNYTSAQSAEQMGWADESTLFLSELLKKPKQKFWYEYDFGDSWIHEITVEKLFPAESAHPTAVCVTGKRACPPEDCGSYPGYGMLLEALAAPVKTDEQKDLLEWIGDDYDPDRFDLNSVNRWLKSR